MPYTQDEGGRLNNFASEPKIYTAEPPSGSEKRNYIILGFLGCILVGGLIAVSYYVSNTSVG